MPPGALLARDVAGTDAAAGLPLSLLVAGSALAAIPISGLSRSAGRRPGLATALGRGRGRAPALCVWAGAAVQPAAAAGRLPAVRRRQHRGDARPLRGGRPQRAGAAGAHDRHGRVRDDVRRGRGPEPARARRGRGGGGRPAAADRPVRARRASPTSPPPPCCSRCCGPDPLRLAARDEPRRGRVGPDGPAGRAARAGGRARRAGDDRDGEPRDGRGDGDDARPHAPPRPLAHARGLRDLAPHPRDVRPGAGHRAARRPLRGAAAWRSAAARCCSPRGCWPPRPAVGGRVSRPGCCCSASAGTRA